MNPYASYKLQLFLLGPTNMVSAYCMAYYTLYFARKGSWISASIMAAIGVMALYAIGRLLYARHCLLRAERAGGPSSS